MTVRKTYTADEVEKAYKEMIAKKITEGYRTSGSRK